ncbi:M66 family metalloprotease [Fibrobacterales bacterium]|nr:M66 family metalloprotease [Fibrobacterales bacterium]
MLKKLYQNKKTLTGLALFGLMSTAQASTFSEITQGFENQITPQPSISQSLDETVFQVVLPSTQKTITLVANYKQEFTEYKAWGGVVKDLNNAGFYIELRDGVFTGELQITDLQQHFIFSSDDDGQLILTTEDPNKGFCTQDKKDSLESPATQPLSFTPPALTPVPNGVDLEKLQSMSNGTGVILIDRDGHTVTDSWWTNNYNSGNSFFATAGGISDDEFYAIWQALTEDYSPFKLNITTDEAVYNTYAQNRRSRLIITENRDWQNVSTTGIASIGGFDNGRPNFCFPKGFGTSQGASRAYKLAEVCSHEVGHALGLYHAGNSSTNYYGGHGTSATQSRLWGPIMGSTYYTQLSHWSKGEYSNSNNDQDNLAIITASNNGLGYKDDDHGNTTATATPLSILSGGTINTTSGIIEKNTDLDLFKFTSGPGSVNITVNPYEYKPNLDAKLEILDNTGSVVASSDPDNVGAPYLNTTLTAGVYYLRIDGVGYLNPLNTGYSDYASLGQYTISGTIPEASGTSSTTLSSSVALSSGQNLSSSEALSSVALSSSDVQSSSSNEVDCEGVPAWENKAYNWTGSKEFVTFNDKLYSHTEWVNGQPDANSTWNFEGNCTVEKSSEALSSSLIISSSSFLALSSSDAISSSSVELIFSSQAQSSEALSSSLIYLSSSQVITVIQDLRKLGVLQLNSNSITFNNSSKSNYKLYDSRGRRLETGLKESAQITWNQPLVKGVYFLNLDNQMVRFNIH